MAERKTKYTNADLKPQGGPATEYGPWTRTPAVDAEYDKVVNAPMSLDEIMASAKGTLRKVQPLKAELNNADRKFRDPQYAAAQADAANMPKQFVRGVRESPVAQGAMVAGSMIPSPLQPVFGGMLAADATARVIEEPSAMNALIAAAQAYPAIKGLKALKGAASTAGQDARFLKHAWPSGVADDAAGTAGPSSGSRLLPSGTPQRQITAGQGRFPGGAPQRQLPPAPPSNLTKLSSTEAVAAGQGPSGGARGIMQKPEYSAWPKSLEVIDDIPAEQSSSDALRILVDEMNSIGLRAPMSKARQATTPSNVIRQRGTADIEAEMRATGASEKDIRQLYHSTQSQGRGVRAEGLPGQVGTGKRLSAEEKRIREILASMGMD